MLTLHEIIEHDNYMEEIGEDGLHLYQIDDGGGHTFAAYSEDQAKAAWQELYGFSNEEVKENLISIDRMDPDKTIRILIGDDTPPERLPKPLVEIDGVKYSIATVAEWCTVAEPGELICSTEY